MLKSKLFWRISACIFLSVLCIEAVLLMFSWFSERDRLIARLDDSASLLVATIDDSNPVPQLQQLMDNPVIDSNFQLTGFRYQSADGKLVEAGKKLFEAHLKTNDLTPGYNLDTSMYLINKTMGEDNSTSRSLWIQVDASWLKAYMRGYVWRISGMILLISLFLTGACLLFLKPLLIDPLRRLNRLLSSEHYQDLGNATSTEKDHNRNDELGAVFRSFSDLRKNILTVQNKLEHLAHHDDLTGLANRRKFNEELNVRVSDAVSNQVPLSLLMLDLDHFKDVNDRWGHAAGDRLLTIVANTMRNTVGDRGTVARQGGDEFAIILPGENSDVALSLAEAIRTNIQGYQFVREKEQIEISISIGLAEITPKIQSADALMLSADTSCLEAKKLGKNQIVNFSSLESDLVSNDIAWVLRIKDALKNDQFTLFKHSIVRINNDQPGEHFEILLRMKNPDGGFYSPAQFLPVSERNNMMPLIDRWVIINALEWLHDSIVEHTDDLCMNINITAQSLATADFREFLRNMVVKYQHLTPYVCFEMTESAAMTNYEKTVELLQWLQAHGCRIALDDFGTGFSSLSHIRNLPLDFIKIDGSFIQEISKNELDQTLVKAVSDIAKVLQIKTVAEFVDNEAALNVLEKLDIDYAQGFLFSEPVALEQSTHPGGQKKVA